MEPPGPTQRSILNIRSTFRTAIENSDLPYACYSCIRLISDLLLQGTRPRRGLVGVLQKKVSHSYAGSSFAPPRMS